MRQEILNRVLSLRKAYLFHYFLIERGYFKAAKRLMSGLRAGNLFVADGADEVYESGLANFLQSHFRCINRKYGFTAYLK